MSSLESIGAPEPRQPQGSTLEKENFGLIVLFIALAILASTLPQPQALGKIPLQNVLKNHLHVKPDEMAKFFLICGLFWYIKPIAGILTDAFPIFKTRRRHYALISAALAAISWIAMMFVPQTYNSLLMTSIVINLFMVMLSTVTGAVLVELGQSTGTVGRLTAVRQFAYNASSLIQGPIGGFLATGALGLAAGVNSIFLASVIPAVYFLLKEKPVQSRPTEAFANAGVQLARIGKSQTFWWALIFITLFYFAPGFSTLLYYRQNDLLKLSQPQIGFLTSIGGLGGILGALIYGGVARTINLRSLLVVSILIASATAIIYLGYNNYTIASVIDFSNGLCFGFAETALLDLAARATPVGSEGLGYSLMLSFRNVSLFGADYLGSLLADKLHWTWERMVVLNTLTTLVVIVLIPFVPKAVLMTKDGASQVSSEAA